MKHDVQVVPNAEKRTTLGKPSLPDTSPIAQIGLRKNRNFGLQNVPILVRWILALSENMAIPRDDVSARFCGSKDRE